MDEEDNYTEVKKHRFIWLKVAVSHHGHSEEIADNTPFDNMWILYPEGSSIVYPSDTSGVAPPTDPMQDPYIVSVKNEMINQFPEHNFNCYALYMESFDTTKKPRDTTLICYMLYSMMKNDHQYYFNKYTVSPSSLKVDAYNVPARDKRFRRIAIKIVKVDSMAKRVIGNIEY